MAKRIKVTLRSDHNETIEVAKTYKLPVPTGEWVVIPTAGGGQYLFPTRDIVSIVIEDVR